MTPGILDPFSPGSAANDDGRDNPFIPKPFYGNARYGALPVIPRDTTFDSILAENSARERQTQQEREKANGNGGTNFFKLMARALGGRGVPAEQSPAPVFDASPSPVFHFDP